VREGEKTEKARRLRRDATDAERRLWRLLRGRDLASHKFRRQHPLGPYVGDFVCLEARLVIELDGGQHDADAETTSARTRLLQARGFRVLRFWNEEMLRNGEGVLAAIEAALRE
jgi:very-short-patch-repair endonuclease